MKNKYTQNQRIYFSLGENKPQGWAIVCGVQGFVIILKPENEIEGYDYTHIYVIDSQIIEPPTDEIGETNVNPIMA
jgi:hypothetical protein